MGLPLYNNINPLQVLTIDIDENIDEDLYLLSRQKEDIFNYYYDILYSQSCFIKELIIYLMINAMFKNT